MRGPLGFVCRCCGQPIIVHLREFNEPMRSVMSERSARQSTAPPASSPPGLHCTKSTHTDSLCSANRECLRSWCTRTMSRRRWSLTSTVRWPRRKKRLSAAPAPPEGPRPWRFCDRQGAQRSCRARHAVVPVVNVGCLHRVSEGTRTRRVRRPRFQRLRWSDVVDKLDRAVIASAEWRLIVARAPELMQRLLHARSMVRPTPAFKSTDKNTSTATKKRRRK
eukprot:Amastigsp_a339239_73.p1 type:complete len:221 gc:universal Amastigsp_a339239_73:996-1658(+)